MAVSPSKIAFKYDFGPALLKKVDPVGMPEDMRFAWFVLILTIVLHLLVLAINPNWFFSTPKVDMEQSIAVDVDFMSQLSLDAPQETALPNAKKADDAAVPANLLPQLPKKFEVEDQKKSEEQPFVEEKDPQAEDSLSEKKVATPEKEEVPKTKEDPNKVTKDDLMKRLAVEKLKQENKIDLQMKAQKNALAKLKEELANNDAKSNSGSGAVGTGVIRARTYADLLRTAVKRNLYLPKTFEYDQVKLVTQLSVIINAKGELIDVRLSKSSGNGAYDQAAIAALQNSVPLPQPPAEIAGQAITFNLSK
jgi:TonB family protein